jgi:CRP-like cAMP-binding protein
MESPEGSGPVRLLTPRQQQELGAIAHRVQLPRRTVVYREHSPAEFIYIVGRGIIKTFRNLPSGRRPVLAFWFPEDVFGLAEAGLYVNTTQAVTDVTLFRLPIAVLKETLANNASLQLQFLCKVTHELRQSQRHSIVVARRDAVGRVAMFLRTLQEQGARDRPGIIDLPMNRADVADFLGLSAEAMSRACRKLERTGVVTFTNRHTARVVDQPELDKLASGA